MSEPRTLDAATLRRTGLRAGLDAVGVAGAAPFDGTRATLETRRADGLHGGMQFTYRNPQRSTDPARALPGARSLVVGARRYPATPPSKPPDGPHARVAAYARADHYAALRAGLGAIADELRAGGWQARVLADDNALVDRAAAHRAGLGWYGKHSNVLLPGRGSWFVLGSVVTDAPLEPATTPVEDGCGSCRRCIVGCPTDAIVARGVVDARRCLAWSLQATGEFPRDQRVALHDRIYGCDECQEVCPHNAVSGDPDGDHRDDDVWVSIERLLEDDDATLLARHGRWYIPERDARYLRRNALVVLGNVGDPGAARTVALLEHYLDGPDDLLRAHAAWAARRLGRQDLLTARAGDPIVRRELHEPAPPPR